MLNKAFLPAYKVCEKFERGFRTLLLYYTGGRGCEVSAMTPRERERDAYAIFDFSQRLLDGGFMRAGGRMVCQLDRNAF